MALPTLLQQGRSDKELEEKTRRRNPLRTPRSSATEVEASKAAQPKSQPKTRMPRSKLFHAGVFCCAWSTLLLSAYFQHQIKAMCKPVFDMIEHSFVAHSIFTSYLSVMALPGLAPVFLTTMLPFIVFGGLGSWYQWGLNVLGEWRMVHIVLPMWMIAIYFMHGSLIMALDLHVAPKWMNKLRMQPAKRCDTAKLPALLLNLATSFTIVIFAIFALGRVLPLQFDEELPGPLACTLYLMTYYHAHEVLLYYVHVLLHHPKIYGKIHKKHHEWTAPVSLSGIDSHPLEVLEEVTVFAIGPLLFSGHYYTMLLWTLQSMFAITSSHCGFAWPWCPESLNYGRHHDLHHEKFSVNFGLFPGKFTFDGLHGTQAEDPWAQ